MATQKPRKRQPKRTVDPALVATVGTPVRLQKPRSKRKPRTPKPTEVAVVVAHEINPVRGFSDFLREYAVVGLAVGFIVGLQAQAVVKSLVDTFINPAFNLLFGQPLVQRSFTLEFQERSVAFPWGAFTYTFLNFLFILLIIFMIVKYFKLDKYQKTSKVTVDQIKEKK